MENPDLHDENRGLTRRRFLQLLAANFAAAGVAGCGRASAGKILPYVRRPPEIVPGVPLGYATAMSLDGFAVGLVVQAREGRPVKVEGNPEHPASLGACGIFAEASVLDLYDPTRADGIRESSFARSWTDVARTLGAGRSDGGAGLRLLLEPTSSPVRAELLARIAERHPRARVHFHAAAADGALRAAAGTMLGRVALPQYRFDRAQVIVSLGADFLSSGPFHLRFARDFASRRRPAGPGAEMNRLYVAETAPSPTGMLADHRLRARPSEIRPLAVALAREIARRRGAAAFDFRDPDDDCLSDAARRWITAVAEDVSNSAPRAVVLAGRGQAAETHAAAFAANALLGSEGESVVFTESPIVEDGEPSHDLATLASDLRGGAVDTVIVAGGNPAFDAPADLDLATLLQKPRTTVRLALRDDETAAGFVWMIPEAHYLESWADARAYDGTASIVQPLIAPLRGGRTVDELLALVAGMRPTDGHSLVRSFYERRLGKDVGAQWEDALSRGLFAGSAAPALGVRSRVEELPRLLSTVKPRPRSDALELRLDVDSPLHDGRFATNLWLLEMPQPVTKLSWDNAALVSPRTAARLRLAAEDVVDLEAGGRRVRAPVLPVPGHADDCFSLALGWGRRLPRSPGSGVGVDGYPLSTSASRFAVSEVQVRKVDDRTARLARAQLEQLEHDRPIVLSRTLAEYARAPDFAADERGTVDSLYEPPGMTAPEQWAMSIDQTICSGCSACLVACQAENNVPTVGKEGVLRRREMYWLRIDHYVDGSHDDPALVSQPMLCQHCEKAPCEYVCPVNATVHSSDGLNEMVYNRCVGTRFCSNNCPYKVRRFNWFDWNERRSELERLVLNPDVTVRERGVMEKCTYCVQRIRRAEIRAGIESREIRVGEVRTACQQACPTGAIEFGSLRHRDGAVSRLHADPRAYEVLHDLGTSPRTRYLARIANPREDVERFASATKERPA